MTEPADKKIPHPDVPQWLGERSWTAPGEPVSQFVVWDTEADQQPFKMAHNRDLMVDAGQIAQDYNFIDYWFGDPAAPVTARYYLGDDEISVDLPSGDRSLTLVEAKAAFPRDVLLYLQKRFGTIRVLVDTGYEVIWP